MMNAHVWTDMMNVHACADMMYVMHVDKTLTYKIEMNKYKKEEKQNSSIRIWFFLQ